MLPAAFRAGRDERLERLLPAELLPLFDDRFIGSCVLFEEYVGRLAVRIAGELGLEPAAREPGTAAEIAARAGLDPAAAPVPVEWLLATLAARGIAAREVGGRYRVAAIPADPDLREILDAQQKHDPSSLASYRMADLAAGHYPAVLHGEVSGEEALFAPDRIGAWFEYFSNDNPIYAISNRLGALAAERALPSGGEILELGGGLGSGAEAILERFAQTGRAGGIRAYRFTEIAPSFLRRGQRRLSARFAAVPLAFSRLDMDRPFAEAGLPAEPFALVTGINTLHVARDLEFTLGEIRSVLKPGGSLVLSECIRPFADRPVGIEFLFNLLGVFRAPRLVAPWRPRGGFLAPENWTAALHACGFRDARVYPDIARIRDVCPAFVVAAITAVRA